MPFSWNPITSRLDLTQEGGGGATGVYHTSPLTAGKVVVGAGTDFVDVTGIDVDGSNNMSNINTISVNDIPTTQSNLDLEPGVDIQVWSTVLDQLALLTPAEGDIIFGNAVSVWDILSRGTNGQVLTLIAGIPAWEDATGGGDVFGPASAVDNNFASFDLTTGKLIQDSGFSSASFLQVANNLSDLGDVTTAQQNLNVEVGVDVQAYSTNLDQFAGLTAVSGDIIFGNGTPEWTTLAKGADGEVLKLVAGFPSWEAETVQTMTWNTVTGTSSATTVNNGYFGSNVAQITFTLPATASAGDEICFVQTGAGALKIAQNSGQTIHTVSGDTTTGVTGFLETINQWSSFCLICTTANTDWAVKQGSAGNLLTT